jgi:alpha-tubulin suppressor-like RCC1 family protein
VYMWGLGIVGQLGDGKMISQSLPQLVVGLEGKGIDSISCSQGQVLAVASSGEVYT